MIPTQRPSTQRRIATFEQRTAPLRRYEDRMGHYPTKTLDSLVQILLSQDRLTAYEARQLGAAVFALSKR